MPIALSLDPGIFHRPKETASHPDSRKQLEANEHEQICIRDNDNDPISTDGDRTEEITNIQTRPFSTGFQHDRPSCSMKAQWPPRGLNLQSKFALDKAERLVSEGALSFEGFICEASHAPVEHVCKYATVGLGAAHEDIEALPTHQSTPADITLTLIDCPGDAKPWVTLEQPTMAQCYGLLPGTITLSRYINSMSRSLKATDFPEYSVQPRQTDNLLVLQRLHYLQSGLDADPQITEEFLYKELVYDPKYQSGKPGGLEQEIAILVAALNNSVWFDFRNTRSQVLAKYFDTQEANLEEHFFQQLLLSVELSLRIQALTSRAEGPDAKTLIPKIPEKVAWDLALAKLWQRKMILVGLDDSFYKIPTAFCVVALTKNIQKERLLDFARTMEWACIADVEGMLEETAGGVMPLESRSLYSESWVNGTILHGPSASLLIMRSLLDCDLSLGKLPHGFDQMHSNLGFQYCGNTFWYWDSIVAKVLGACEGVKQAYGWVGPCIASDDLDNFEIVLARSDSARHRMSTSYVKSMSARSAALGPQVECYLASEYFMPSPDLNNVFDNITIQKLAFKSCSVPISPDDPETLHAAVIFAVGNEMIPIRLRYEVSFICAPACCGTHPLFWDYAYETVKPDELVLGKRPRNSHTVGSHSTSNESSPTTSGFEDSCRASISVGPRGPEAILVVEAYGNADNEVLARAWASYLGVSAVVADIKHTCMACAVRMAYAAATPLVILNEGHHKNG